MRSLPLIRNLAFLAVVSLLAGCGGNSSSGDSSAAVRSVTRSAVGPMSDTGTPATGFDASGAPVFVAVRDDWSKWTVSSGADAPLYEIALPDALDSRPGAVSGRYVVGDYEGADGVYDVAVSKRADDGTVAVSTYPGYLFSVCDGGTAIVYDSTVDGNAPYFSLDLATGAIAPVALPAGAAPYAMKGKYVLCSTGGSGRGRSRKAGARSPGGMVLYDLESRTSTALQAPSGTDGSVYAYVLNSKGQTLGVDYVGDGTQMRLWSKSGVPGPVLESVAAGHLDPGWLSEDARKMSFSKYEDGVSTAYMRVGSKSYALRSDAFPLGSLYGLNAQGTKGFGYDPDLDATIGVSVSYR